MTLFEAYVTNAGKYADYGVDAGEILKFPHHHRGGAVTLKEDRRGRCAVSRDFHCFF